MNPTNNTWLLAVTLAVALAVLFFPSARMEDLKALTAKGEIAIVGNSVIKTASRCDADTRGIAEMMAAETGKAVTDLSVGGQTLDQSLQLAALALRNQHVRSVVVPLVISSRLVHDSFDLQSWLFYRALNARVPPTQLAVRFQQGRLFAGQSPINGAAFDYKGVSYPDYDGVKLQFFAKEQRRTSCPEAFPGGGESGLRRGISPLRLPGTRDS